MSSRIIAIIFSASFLAFTISSIPLSVVVAALKLEARGMTYSRAEGTLWNGHIYSLAWRGRGLGDVTLSVQPLSLLLARLDVNITFGGRGSMAGNGTVSVWPNASVALRNVSLIADVGMMPVVLPLKGSIKLGIRRADFSRSGCRAVDAEFQTNALVERPAGLDWQGPMLSGTATCKEGILMLPLTGGDGTEIVAVTMKLAGDGTFSVQAEARTLDEAVKRALSLAGFTDIDGAMTLTQNGRWS
jgi:general secretion pathway protein N